MSMEKVSPPADADDDGEAALVSGLKRGTVAASASGWPLETLLP